MKAVIQRVTSASVCINGQTTAKIGQGLCVLLGIGENDGSDDVDYTIDRIIKMRIFEDSEGKMNLSLADVGGELLIVPNFTLYGDVRSRRPGFTLAAKPDKAAALFELMKIKAAALYPPTKLAFGVFQAEMLVDIKNDGPVTLIVES